MSKVERRPCTPSALTGIWVPVKSEIPEFDLASEIYEFTADRHFLWHFPHLGMRSNVSKFIYELDGLTLKYGKTESDQFSIQAWLEEDVLVFQPKHGFKTHSRKQGEPADT